MVIHGTKYWSWYPNSRVLSKIAYLLLHQGKERRLRKLVLFGHIRYVSHYSSLFEDVYSAYLCLMPFKFFKARKKPPLS